MWRWRSCPGGTTMTGASPAERPWRLTRAGAGAFGTTGFATGAGAKKRMTGTSGATATVWWCLVTMSSSSASAG